MRLVVQVAIDNEVLDGPNILRALAHGMDTVVVAIQAEIAEGSTILAPKDFSEPVRVAWKAHWESSARGIPTVGIPPHEAPDSQEYLDRLAPQPVPGAEPVVSGNPTADARD